MHFFILLVVLASSIVLCYFEFAIDAIRAPAYPALSFIATTT